MFRRFWLWLDTPVSWMGNAPIYVVGLMLCLLLWAALDVLAVVLSLMGVR